MRSDCDYYYYYYYYYDYYYYYYYCCCSSSHLEEEPYHIDKRVAIGQTPSVLYETSHATQRWNQKHPFSLTN